MAIYKYTARDRSGNKFSGTYSNIESIAALRREFNKIGCTLVRARRERKHVRTHRKITQGEIVTFVYEFAGMFAAGLPIPRCLSILETQVENPSMKHVLSDIRESIETGSTLKDAFGKHVNIFSGFLIGMLEAGESSGRLQQTLEMSAEYLETQADMRRRVKSAFIYPLILSVVCLLVVSGLLAFVIPTFSKIYNQLKVPLPPPTQFLVDLSSFVTHWWLAILLAIASLIVAARQYRRISYLKRRWDFLKLKIPVFGKLNRMVLVSQFTRTFAMLASTGVPFVRAFDIASQVTNNARMADITVHLQSAVESGYPVAHAMQGHDIFPQMIVQLATSGEESGTLPDMLNKGVDFLDKVIARTVNTMIVKLEPTLTIIVGLVIGFMLIAVYLPLFDYMRHVR